VGRQEPTIRRAPLITLINCRNCIHWLDESLDRIEANPGRDPRLLWGCRLLGFVENNTALPHCDHYVVSENLFVICNTCKIVVPKVCVSLGECANCTDTDLFCVDQCLGGDQRKYCTHFLRLHTEGLHLVDKDQVFDLFPMIGMPGNDNESQREKQSGDSQEPGSRNEPKPRTGNRTEK
jgi:hypothetical protein